MAFQSVWYYTDLPEDIVDIIERTYLKLLMKKWETPNCMEMLSTKTSVTSQNAWIPTTHWVGGFLWHYIQRANRELSCVICGVLMGNQCNTPDMVKVSSTDGIMMQDLPHNTNQWLLVIVLLMVSDKTLDEILRWFVNCLLRCNSLTLMIMRVVTCNCWMKLVTLILFPVNVARLYCLIPAHNTEF